MIGEKNVPPLKFSNADFISDLQCIWKSVNKGNNWGTAHLQSVWLNWLDVKEFKIPLNECWKAGLQLLQSERETLTAPAGSRGVETILYIQEEYDLTLLPFDAQVFALLLMVECWRKSSKIMQKLALHFKECDSPEGLLLHLLNQG